MKRATSLVLIVLVVTACGGADVSPTTTTATTATTATTSASAAGPTTSAAASTTTPDASTTTTAAPTTTTEGPTTYEFTVTAGTVDGPEKIEAAVGDEIVIEVSADVADEVHLHGYDVFADVAPGAPARLEVITAIPGIFEMELEGARLVLAELEVR